jgi:hypothetical protein
MQAKGKRHVQVRELLAKNPRVQGNYLASLGSPLWGRDLGIKHLISQVSKGCKGTKELE